MNLHRAENTDDPSRLARLVDALNQLNRDIPVVLPLHPRARQALSRSGLKLNVQLIEPEAYLEMLWLLRRCGLVVTDSGGFRRRLSAFAKPCVTLRDQTEWVELIECGANVLAGSDTSVVLEACMQMIGRKIEDPHALYGGGMASDKIVSRLLTR